jgi:N-acetylneuraminic acid mutarotase
MLLAPLGANVPGLRWNELAPLPDAQGFAGPFAGVASGALLVAAGANFPEKRPWDGGRKTWHDRIFLLEDPGGSWREAGRLPRPIAYGCAATLPQGVVCIGGNDERAHYADVFLLELKQGMVSSRRLAALPYPLAYAAAAVVGNTLYVGGGQEHPDKPAQPRFLALDLHGDPAGWRWRELPSWGGRARILPLAAAFEGGFFLVGGADLARPEPGRPLVRTYLRDAWRYTPHQGWGRIADLPWPVVAAPTPAPAYAGGFLVFGGDDGSQSSPAQINDLRDRHPGFRPDVLVYQASDDKWSVGPPRPHHPGPDPARRPDLGHWAAVVTSVVPWRNLLVLPSGEARPGVRTPRVAAVTLLENEGRNVPRKRATP